MFGKIWIKKKNTPEYIEIDLLSAALVIVFVALVIGGVVYA